MLQRLRHPRFMAMHKDQITVVLKRFETPDETRVMTKGKFELVHIGGMTIGRATYEPGWKWSEHVGPGVGQARCSVEHVGLVLSGRSARQLGGGRGAVRLAAFPRRRPLRQIGRGFQVVLNASCASNARR